MNERDMLHQARQHIEANEFDRAESLCADVLVTDPVSVPAHQLMAQCVAAAKAVQAL